MSAAERAAEVRSNMKRVFRKWDTDNSGTITRKELISVMKKLAGWDSLTCNTLMDEIDQNMDGEIQYEEFVEWIMNPDAKSKIDGSCMELSSFNLASALKPIFLVYDRDDSGFITADEFEECHQLLQGSLKLHPIVDAKARDTEPTLGVKPIHKIFDDIDVDQDREIAFEEFVSWQRKLIIESGIPNYELVELTAKLAGTLERILHIDHQQQAGLADDSQHVTALEKLIQELANNTRALWTKRPDLSADAKRSSVHMSKYSNHWSEPPVGLSLDRLIRFHMVDVPVRTHRLKDCKVEARLCIPQPPYEVNEGIGRLWFAKVIRKTLYSNQPDGIPNEEAFYYIFHDLKWNRMVQKEDIEQFYHARDTLAPELRMFCLLKTEANMGVNIAWKGIQAAFRDALELELLTMDALEKYNNKMKALALDILKQDGDDDDGRKPEDKALEFLEQRLQMPPRHVMAALSEFGIMQPSPVWSEFMTEED